MLNAHYARIKRGTYNSEVDEGVSRLRRLEVDPAPVEAPVRGLDVIQKQKSWV